MKHMLFAVFDNEGIAHVASESLQRLSDDGAIALGSGAIVTKNPDGATAIVRTHRLRPDGAMGGTALGLLIGLYGGFTGLAIGAALGLVLGALSDVLRARVDDDFVADVVHSLEPGKAALVAEIDEDFTESVDARLRVLGGRVFRRDLSEVADTEYETEIGTLRANVARRKAERAARRSARRRSVQDWIDSVRRKLAQGPMKER